MTEITVKIKDSLVQTLGVEYLQKFFDKQIELLELQHIAEEIGKSMRNAGVNWDQEFEKAREEAWEEYKRATLSKRK